MCQRSAGWLLNFAEEKDIEQPVRKSYLGGGRDLHDLPHQIWWCVLFEKVYLINPETSVKRIVYSQVSNKYVHWGRNQEAAARLKYRECG